MKLPLQSVSRDPAEALYAPRFDAYTLALNRPDVGASMEMTSKRPLLATGSNETTLAVSRRNSPAQGT
jgi:hypothetical protein